MVVVLVVLNIFDAACLCGKYANMSHSKLVYFAHFTIFVLKNFEMLWKVLLCDFCSHADWGLQSHMLVPSK